MRSQLEVTEMLQCKVNLTLLVFRETLLHRSCGLYAWKWVVNLSSNGRLNLTLEYGYWVLITMPRKEARWWWWWTWTRTYSP